MASKTPTYLYSIYEGIAKRIIREELEAQGHVLSGDLSEKIDVVVEKTGNDYIFSVFMLYYAQFLHEGIPKENISWSMFPSLIKYFIQRGFPPHFAKKLAAATIQTWKKEGMPSKGSAAFSSTGKRKAFAVEAFRKYEQRMDVQISAAIDFEIDLHFSKIKSERL